MPSTGLWRDYDVLPDGSVVALVDVKTEENEPPRMRMIFHWFDELRASSDEASS